MFLMSEFIDRFTMTALVLMVGITTAFVICAYIGHLGEVGEMDGTDAIVEEMAADTVGKETTSVLPAFLTDIVGEPLGFTIAGIAAGFIVGYFWIDISASGASGRSERSGRSEKSEKSGRSGRNSRK